MPLLYLPFEQADSKLAHQLSQPTQKAVGAAHTSVPIVALLLFLAALIIDRGRNAKRYWQVVLWFGPTMVFQLSLIQLLDWFAGHYSTSAVCGRRAQRVRERA